MGVIIARAKDYTWQISGFEDSLSLSVKSLGSYQSSPCSGEKEGYDY